MAAVPARRDDPVSSAADSIESFVRLAQEGDSRAFEEVYRRTVGRVYAICLRMAGDGDEASELVQDVFVRAWQRLGSFRGDALFTTWLHRLAVNHVLQERRGRVRRASHEVSEPDLERFGRAAPTSSGPTGGR
jgi:RNA polymerase sigma-70 factor (ECF subfamily)